MHFRIPSRYFSRAAFALAGLIEIAALILASYAVFGGL